MGARSGISFELIERNANTDVIKARVYAAGPAYANYDTTIETKLGLDGFTYDITDKFGNQYTIRCTVLDGGKSIEYYEPNFNPYEYEASVLNKVD